MQLPPRLRAAVDRALDGVAPSVLMAAAQRLSDRYRAEIRDGTPHLADERAALAYLGSRLPATYAAIRRSLEAVAEAHPDFAPATMLDAGAGPGTALWAAVDCWPGLNDAFLVESSLAIRSVGAQLLTDSGLSHVWSNDDLMRGLPDEPPRDLVTLAYVLDELAPEKRDTLVDRLWQLTAGVLVIVEPGTPAGWQSLSVTRPLPECGGAITRPPSAETASRVNAR